jgi:hypothetical protein
MVGWTQREQLGWRKRRNEERKLQEKEEEGSATIMRMRMTVAMAKLGNCGATGLLSASARGGFGTCSS